MADCGRCGKKYIGNYKHLNAWNKPCVEKPARRATASGGSIKPLLGEETHQLVKFRAASMGISASELVRTAVRHYMKTHAGFVHEPVVKGVNDYSDKTVAVPAVYTGLVSE